MPFQPFMGLFNPAATQTAMGQRGLLGPQLPPGLAPQMPWQAPRFNPVNRVAKGDMLRLPMHMPSYGAPPLPEGLLGATSRPLAPAPLPAAPVQPRAKSAPRVAK